MSQLAKHHVKGSEIPNRNIALTYKHCSDWHLLKDMESVRLKGRQETLVVLYTYCTHG